MIAENTIDLSRYWPATLFLSGIMMVTFAASGLFFLKFWSRTRQPFFLAFALACWMISIERVLMLFVGVGKEIHPSSYILRLVAFSLIMAAFLQANRKRKNSPP